MNVHGGQDAHWVTLYQTRNNESLHDVFGERVHGVVDGFEQWRETPDVFEYEGAAVLETWESWKSRFRYFHAATAWGDRCVVVQHDARKTRPEHLAEIYGRLHRKFWVQGRVNVLADERFPRAHGETGDRTLRYMDLQPLFEEANQEYDSKFGAGFGVDV